MATHLEERRQAIVAALRSVMAEPLPTFTPPAPAPAISAADDYYDDDRLDWETPSVPPLETSPSMSPVASLALFGHA